MRSYSRISAQRASACGSAACRLAFMGNSVRGRFSVSFQSAMRSFYSTGRRPYKAKAGAPERGRRPSDRSRREYLPAGVAARNRDPELAGVVVDDAVVDAQEQL